jgi:hypothetical protein
MRLFRYWSKERCLEYIDELEKAVALGAKTTSFQGQVTSWSSLEEVSAILDQLYARVDAIDGKRRGSALGGIRIVQIVPERGL